MSRRTSSSSSFSDETACKTSVTSPAKMNTLTDHYSNIIGNANEKSAVNDCNDNNSALPWKTDIKSLDDANVGVNSSFKRSIKLEAADGPSVGETRKLVKEDPELVTMETPTVESQNKSTDHPLSGKLESSFNATIQNFKKECFVDKKINRGYNRTTSHGDPDMEKSSADIERAEPVWAGRTGQRYNRAKGKEFKNYCKDKSSPQGDPFQGFRDDRNFVESWDFSDDENDAATTSQVTNNSDLVDHRDINHDYIDSGEENCLEKLAGGDSLQLLKPDTTIKAQRSNNRHECIYKLDRSRETHGYLVQQRSYLPSKSCNGRYGAIDSENANTKTNYDPQLSHNKKCKQEGKTNTNPETTIDSKQRSTSSRQDVFDSKITGKVVKPSMANAAGALVKGTCHIVHAGFNWDKLAKSASAKAQPPKKDDVYSFNIDDHDEFSFEMFDKQVLHKRRKMSSERYSRPLRPETGTATWKPASDALCQETTAETPEKTTRETENKADLVLSSPADNEDDVNTREISHTACNREKRLLENFDENTEQVLKINKWDSPVEQSFSSLGTKRAETTDLYQSQSLDTIPDFSELQNDTDDAEMDVKTRLKPVPCLLDLTTMDHSDESSLSTRAGGVKSRLLASTGKPGRLQCDGRKVLYDDISRNTPAVSDLNNGAEVWIRDSSDRTELNLLDDIGIGINEDSVQDSDKAKLTTHHIESSCVKFEENLNEGSLNNGCLHRTGAAYGSVKQVEETLALTNEHCRLTVSGIYDSATKTNFASNHHSDLSENVVTETMDTSDDQQSVWNETLKHFILQNLECSSNNGDGGGGNGQEVAGVGIKALKRPSVEEKLAEDFLHKKLDSLRKHHQSPAHFSTVPAIMGQETRVTGPSVVAMATSQEVLDLTETRSNTFPAVIYSAYNGEITHERMVTLPQRLGLAMLNIPNASVAYDNMSAILDEAECVLPKGK